VEKFFDVFSTMHHTIEYFIYQL